MELCQRQDKSQTFCSVWEAAGVLCNTTEETYSHHVRKRQAADIVTLGTEVLNHLGLTDCNKIWGESQQKKSADICCHSY